MANHKSALKRARQNKVRRLRNRIHRTKAKNAIKEVYAAVEENSAESAQERLVEAMAVLQKTAAKGIIHKNKAARKISRLARQVSQIPAA